jgi:transposase
LYLVSSDEKLSYQQIITLYQKRWKVEQYHKSLKHNASLAASPTKTVKTQSNHVFMSLVAYCKLELLKIKNGLNHFAFKAQLYTKAMALAINELRNDANGIQLKFNFA